MGPLEQMADRLRALRGESADRDAAAADNGHRTGVAEPAWDAELAARRDRLLEVFAIMQSDLGGAFYEMAIRDHLRIDVLTQKAAQLQRIDTELAQIDELMQTGR
ncbi:MAG: hypothetical protein QOG09_989 [Solirubrobacterales bacterium]|jgi:hypothetical protein|nr:hypothetical protein [Solirubrobacterales bacterium]